MCSTILCGSEHEREMLEEEKPGIIARLVGKEKKHIKPEVREKKMTKLNEKLHDSPRTTKNLDIKILVVEDNDLIQQVTFFFLILILLELKKDFFDFFSFKI